MGYAHTNFQNIGTNTFTFFHIYLQFFYIIIFSMSFNHLSSKQFKLTDADNYISLSLVISVHVMCLSSRDYFLLFLQRVHTKEITSNTRAFVKSYKPCCEGFQEYTMGAKKPNTLFETQLNKRNNLSSTFRKLPCNC